MKSTSIPPSGSRLERPNRSRRALAVAAALSLVGIGIATSSAVVSPDAAAAELGRGACIPTNPDNPLSSSGTGQFIDNNPGVYVGGNATFLNHEGEGLVVVDGDALFDAPASYAFAYQLGAGAGGGSGSWPARNALMLAVGGDVNVAPGETLNVGQWDRKGTWYVGGAVNGNVQYAQDGEWPNQIPLRVDSISGTPADGYRGRLDSFSEAVGSLPTTGTVVPSGDDRLILRGDGSSPMQVFDLDYLSFSDVLTAPVAHLDLVDIPEGASIVLNVLGGDQILITSAVRFTLNGDEVTAPTPPYTSWATQDLAEWGALTQRLLWHFPTQSDIQLGHGGAGHDQFTGSILADSSSTHLRTHASTNGRVISFGDFTMYEGDENTADPSQSNLAEFHSFPFLFPGLGCSETSAGTFSLQKTVEGLPADYTLPDGTAFRVAASWVDQNGAAQTAMLDLPADGGAVYPTVDGGFTSDPESALYLPGDTVVTFQEVGIILPEGTDLPTGVALGSATFSAASVVAGAAGPVATVTLTNTYTQSVVDRSGTFNLRKILDGVPADAFPEGTTFPVTASWDGGAKTFELPADGSVVSADIVLPEGTVVSFQEGDLPEPPKGYSFVSSVVSAPSVTILAEDDRDIAWAVTNTYETVKDPGDDPGTDPGDDPGTDPGDDPGTDPGETPAGDKPAEEIPPSAGGDLPKTGSSGTVALLIGGFSLIGVGAGVYLMARRRSL